MDDVPKTTKSVLQSKISVVMPAYNEASNIIANIRETVETLRDLGLNFEVIVVDDGSRDQTWVAAVQDMHDFKGLVKVLHYSENLGKGNALMCGTYYATGDYIAFLDADMDLHPSQLTTFFAIMDVNDADVVIGSKRHPASSVNYPRSRRILSAGYYLLVRALFGLPIHDTQTGLKVFRAEVLRVVFPKVLVKRFAFDLEVLSIAHRLGYKIVEAPVTLNFQREFGRIGLTDVTNIALSTLAVFARLRLTKYYDRHNGDWQAPDSIRFHESSDLRKKPVEADAAN